MTRWEPLIFEPVFRDYLWGGRRLKSVLGKPIGDGPTWAESWEVVDHGDDQSVVAEGAFAGLSLHELALEHGPSLLGESPALQGAGGGFPLLFKFLDAQKILSLQVHPNDAQAAGLTPPDLGKTEAWVILDAAPGALLYAGLRPGVGRKELREALAAGEAERRLHALEPAAGDCVFLPAGTPHAIGGGLLVAEIQQASNTTFRLHDWNRVGADGRPRELHLEQGLDVIDFDCGPVRPQRPQPTGEPGRERLVACDKFVMDRLQGGPPRTIGGDQRFHILSVLAGEATAHWDGGRRSLGRGDTTLLPAALAVKVDASDDAVILDMRLP